MKHILHIIAVLALAAGTALNGGKAMAAENTRSAEQAQEIIHAGSQPAIKGPAEWFTGNVTIQPLFGPKHPDAPFGAAYVTFEAGARSFWHTHPTGQHLIITDGIGRTGTADGKIEEFKAGDALWCPAGVKHWHGASPASAMTHIALTGTLADGKNVEWMEEVSDKQYNGDK